MFSTRTRWDRTSNRLSRILEEKRAAGRVVLDLTQGNPTRAEIPYPDDLLSALGDRRGLRYDPSPSGWVRAREAVAGEYQRHGARVDPDHLLLTTSTSEAYSYAFKLLCDPGDDVLVPQPSYPLFDFLAGLESIAVRPYPLMLAAGEWHVDVDALRAQIGPRTRAIVVVHPNNPTGSFLKKDEAAALFESAAEKDLAILSDEVFLDYAMGPDPRRAGSLATAEAALTLAMGGLSKSCGLPQLKLGWLAVAGPAARRDEALARLEIIADTYLSVGAPLQLAAADLLRRGAGVRKAIAARVCANHATLKTLLRDRPASLLPVEGGWYGVLQVPATRSEEDLAVEMLEAHDVLVHPGFFFGMPEEAFLVVSLLPPPSILAEGVGRLLSTL